MTLYVSVRRQVVVNNKKLGRNDPPYEVRQSKSDPKPQTVHDASYTGTVRLVYDPGNPLISGAICWMEIDEAPVEVLSCQPK
jgi:hypothetical protein